MDIQQNLWEAAKQCLQGNLQNYYAYWERSSHNDTLSFHFKTHTGKGKPQRGEISKIKDMQNNRENK